MKLFKSWKCRHQGSSNVIPASNNHTVEVMNKDFLELFEEEKNLILLQRIKNIIRTFAYYVKQSIENQKYTCLWILISEGFILYRANAYRNIGLIWKKNQWLSVYRSRNSTQDEVLLSVNWLMTEKVGNGDWITY